MPIFWQGSLDENNKGTPKIRNNFWWIINFLNFFNIAIAILDFSLLLPKYCFSNFTLAKYVTLNLLAFFIFCFDFVYSFMASFLYCSQNSYRSSNYYERATTITLERAIKKISKNWNEKLGKKRLRVIDIFTRSTREKLNIAIAILEK